MGRGHALLPSVDWLTADKVSLMLIRLQTKTIAKNYMHCTYPKHHQLNRLGTISLSHTHSSNYTYSSHHTYSPGHTYTSSHTHSLNHTHYPDYTTSLATPTYPATWLERTLQVALLSCETLSRCCFTSEYSCFTV